MVERERGSRCALSEHGSEGTGRQRWSVGAHPPLPDRVFCRATSPHTAAQAGRGAIKKERKKEGMKFRGGGAQKGRSGKEVGV